MKISFTQHSNTIQVGWCSHHNLLNGESCPLNTTSPVSLRHTMVRTYELISLVFTTAHTLCLRLAEVAVVAEFMGALWLGDLSDPRAQTLVCPNYFICGLTEEAYSLGSHCSPAMRRTDTVLACAILILCAELPQTPVPPPPHVSHLVNSYSTLISHLMYVGLQ